LDLVVEAHAGAQVQLRVGHTRRRLERPHHALTEVGGLGKKHRVARQVERGQQSTQDADVDLRAQQSERNSEFQRIFRREMMSIMLC
jgi:hypothetical protein